MSDAVIIDAVRSPMGKGKPGGALSELHPVELLAQVLVGLVERNGLDPGTVDDVLIGCVSQAGEQSGTPGRMAWLAAGFPEHVPSVTIERKCGSSQQAIAFAAQGVMAGAYDVVIAGGVESMSRVPMGSARMGRDPFGPSVTERYGPGLVSQGVAAELVAADYGIARNALDEYSVRSHRLAHQAAIAGAFDAEILPVSIETAAGKVTVATDETIRPGTTADALAQLRPAFVAEEAAARFPEIDWRITAGNSSQITDGAAAVLIMSTVRAARLGLRPRARFTGFSVCADNPIRMLTSPIPATRKVLQQCGLTLGQIDSYEVNEAFASVPLAWQQALGADLDKLNPRGGAIALGHPLGASGARLLATLLYTLEDGGLRYGLQTMCEAGGMANSMIIETV